MTLALSADDAALAALREALGPGDVVRLGIDGAFAADLAIDGDPAAPGDVEVLVAEGVRVRLDAASASRADGVRIAFDAGAGAFRVDNPNAPPRVRALGVADYQAMRARGEAHVLYDVRTEAEMRIARIEGAKPFDAPALLALEDLDRETTLVFQCHHGIRSRAAAERAVSLGFRRVFNLEGGIDAWSLRVDPEVPRY